MSAQWDDVPDLLAEYRVAVDERNVAWDRNATALARHQDDAGICDECNGYSWPCPTVRALTGGGRL